MRGIRHQDLHVVGGRLGELWVFRRKHEQDFSDGSDLSRFLMDVECPGFHFRPDPTARQTPVTGVLAPTGNEPHGGEAIPRPRFQQRTHLWTCTLGAGQDPLRVARYNPKIMAAHTRILNNTHIVGCVA